MDIKTSNKVTGIKQSTRAIESGEAFCAFVANDCDDKIRLPFLALCRKHSVEVTLVESMAKLGELCGIDVGAAVTVILR